MPAPGRIIDLLSRFDSHLHAQEMGDPAFEHARQRGQPRVAAPRREEQAVADLGHALVSQVERIAVAVALLPVRSDVVGPEHRQLRWLERRLVLYQQAAQLAEARGLVHQFGVLRIGAQHLPVVQRNPLRPKQQLAGAQLEAVAAVAQQVMDERVDHQIDEQRRDRDAPAADQREVPGFERPGAEQRIAKGEEVRIVLPHVGVAQRAQLARRDRPGRLVDEGGMQRALGAARAVFGREFGPRQKAAQIGIGGDEPAALVGAQMSQAAGRPEILHRGIIRAPNVPPPGPYTAGSLEAAGAR